MLVPFRFAKFWNFFIKSEAPGAASAVARRSTPRPNRLDQYQILRYPLTSENCMKMVEENNTLTFIVDTRANKRQIADAVRRMYEIKTAKVNTLIRPNGTKKAYVRLTSDYDALDVANKVGII